MVKDYQNRVIASYLVARLVISIVIIVLNVKVHINYKTAYVDVFAFIMSDILLKKTGANVVQCSSIKANKQIPCVFVDSVLVRESTLQSMG
jgi:hypothetical protein